MFKKIIELENSTNVLDRQEYAVRLKNYILQWEQQLPLLKELSFENIKSLDYNFNKEAIKKLKIRLSEYDIYNQKKRCRYCHQYVCKCNDFKESDWNL